jgi:signal peptidase complex subunit 2
VKVNNANATELKNACDDAVKRYLSRPELFKQIYLHTDVRLGLGWLGVFIAAGTALYGYKVDFEKSKPVVTIGLVVYIILTAIQTLYAFFIEGNIIFVGKRKSFSKRIITERIQLTSSTLPPSTKTPSLSPANAPSYQLAVSYVRSTNGGKSLLAKGRTKSSKTYSAFFDEQGTMDQDAFERWVGELVEEGMDGKLQ